jgi:hypothetical protein
MTDPVEFLKAAHNQADAAAVRLHSELWWIGNAARIEAYTAGGIQFDDIGYVSENGGHTVTVTEAIQRGLLAGSPEDLSRRVAADRKILADLLAQKHYVLEDAWYRCSASDRAGDRNGNGKCDCGRDARVQRHVRLLAEGWGWTEETT